jgi:predicted nucleic acid-binding Zn ribbon protein
MPIYDYSCTDCGRQFEVFQNITDPKFTKHSDVTQGHHNLPKPCKGKLYRHIGTVGYRRDHTIVDQKG